MATVNQMMARSGQPNRFAFHIETNNRATRITPRNIRSDPGLTTCLWLIYAIRNIGPLISYQRFRLWGQESADSCPQIEHHPNAYEPVQFPVGVSTQSLIFNQALARLFPILVFLIPSQKTNATRRTINVYSTKPCPSSSTTNLFKSSIVLSPPFFVIMLVCRKSRYYAGNL